MMCVEEQVRKQIDMDVDRHVPHRYQSVVAWRKSG